MDPVTSLKHRRQFQLFAWVPASVFAFVCSSLFASQARVFDTQEPSAEPIYRYELSKSREGAVETWNARFIDAGGKDFAIENTVLRDGGLVRYTLRQPELGEEAEIRRTSEGVVFRYLKDGKWKEDFERTSDNVLAGPQIVDAIVQNWDAIVAGKRFSVRFAVPDRLETIGFRFSHRPQPSGENTVFHFAPSNFFIRQFVDPVVLVFNSKTRQVISIKGRTFLRKKKNSEWETLFGEFRFGS